MEQPERLSLRSLRLRIPVPLAAIPIEATLDNVHVDGNLVRNTYKSPRNPASVRIGNNTLEAATSYFTRSYSLTLFDGSMFKRVEVVVSMRVLPFT
jgi:hypothetical protein